MNESILHTEVQEFIETHLDADITTLLLQGSPFPEIRVQELAIQIISKKKCQNKLPTWYKTPAIYYPNKLHIEQTSSEITARYKSELAAGKVLVDITGGLGVDAYFFSKNSSQVIHCEVDETLSAIAKYNFNVLGINNITSVPQDGLAYLDESPLAIDWIYADPSRRHEKKGKVFFLNDCLPNIPENLPLLFSKSRQVLLKTSPLLDISVGIKELTHVKEVHCVAVNNEVKELLWILDKAYRGSVNLKAVNLSPTATQSFSYYLGEDTKAVLATEEPSGYLYEPHAALLKIGAFNGIATAYSLQKLATNTHLYTSEDYLTDFPGRVFTIENVFSYTKKNMHTRAYTQANVSTRNFPVSVNALRKKHKIADGGDTYLFFTTWNKKRIVIQAQKPA